MGKKGKNAAMAAGAAAEVERKKKLCSNCGKVGSSHKNFRKCAFCELTRCCSKDCQKNHWKVRLTSNERASG